MPKASSSSSPSAPRILVVTHSCPWPPVSGGKMDMYGRLKALRALGVRLVVVMTVKEEAAERARILKELLGLDACYVLPRCSTLFQALHPVWPFQIASRRGKRWAQLAADLAGQSFALVLAEGTYVLPMSAALAEGLGAPLWHRLHNLESRYFLSLATSEAAPWKKAFFFLEALRFRRLEPRLLQLGRNLCISTEEVRELAARFPGSRTCWLPPALSQFPAAGVTYRPGPGRRFLITGSLALADTWEGVRWFTGQIWPRLRRDLPDAVLVIAGRRPPPAAAAWLAQVPGVETQYDVPDMAPLFRAADIYVSPVRHGAGVKMKTVEALSYGLPVVATPVAAQGCGLEHGRHLLIAAGDEEFRRKCLYLAEDAVRRKTLGTQGRAYVQEAFDQEAHLEGLLHTWKILS